MFDLVEKLFYGDLKWSKISEQSLISQSVYKLKQTKTSFVHAVKGFTWIRTTKSGNKQNGKWKKLIDFAVKQCTIKSSKKRDSLKIQKLSSSWKYKNSCHQQTFFSFHEFSICAFESFNWTENFGLFVNENYCTFCELNTAGHRCAKLITVLGQLMCKGQFSCGELLQKNNFFLCRGKFWSQLTINYKCLQFKPAGQQERKKSICLKTFVLF